MWRRKNPRAESLLRIRRFGLKRNTRHGNRQVMHKPISMQTDL